MLVFNCNTHRKIVKIIATNTGKFIASGLVIGLLITLFFVSYQNVDNPNYQSAAPVYSGTAASELPSDVFNMPESVFLNSPQADNYVGKLTRYLKPIEFTLTATDYDGDQLVFSASNLPDGASFDPETRTFSWTPRYDQAGVYTVHFEVSDGQSTDSEDITITVVQPYEDWDVNGDSASNILDMILIGQHWGETGLTGWITEDANEDGTINVLDIIIIGQHWTD